jgi:hypothetical protein
MARHMSEAASLSDDEYAAVLAAAGPIHPMQRRFLAKPGRRA